MPLFVWKPGYSVGVKAMDDQHLKLVGLINKLHEAMLEGQAKSVMQGVLDELFAYTKMHFGAEELLLQQYRYAGLPQQQIEHSAFTKKIGEYCADHEAGKLTLSLDVMAFLKDWLQNHIAGEDKMYTAFLNSRGVY